MTSRGIKLGDFVKRGKKVNGGGKFNQFQNSAWRSNALDSFRPKDKLYQTYASDYIDFSVNDVVFPETVDNRCINWAENDIQFVKWSNGNNGRPQRYSGGAADWSSDDVGHPHKYNEWSNDDVGHPHKYNEWSNDNMGHYQRSNSEGSGSNHSSPIQEVVGGIAYYGTDQFASPGDDFQRRREEIEGGITYYGTSPYYGVNQGREEVEGGITYYGIDQGEDFQTRREFQDPREDFHRRREFEGICQEGPSTDEETRGYYGEGGQPGRQIGGCYYVEDIEQYFESGARDYPSEAEEYYRGAELYYEEVPKEKIAEGMGLVELEEVTEDEKANKEQIKELNGVEDVRKGEKPPKEEGAGGMKRTELEQEVKEAANNPVAVEEVKELSKEQIMAKVIAKKNKNAKKKLLPKKKVDEAFVHFPEESLVLTETDQRESAEHIEETGEKEEDLCSKDFELLQIVESIIGDDDDDDDVDFDDREEEQE